LRPGGVLGRGEGALVAEGAFPEPVQVGRFGVVGAVDDPKVVAAADLEAGLGESLAAAGEVGGGLDDHALATGRGEFFPPCGGRGGAGGGGGVHDDAPGGREQVGVGGDQPVGEVQVPAVWSAMVGGAFGGEELERGQPHAGQALGGPAVPTVGVGERGGVGGPGPGAVE